MKKKDLSRHFSRNYAEARSRILNQIRLQGDIRHDSYTHPLTAPDGGTLATDIAWRGPEDARGVLIVSSGLHGIEGFAGSAIQNRALSQNFLSDLPPEMAVVCVHALNPHGYAHQRRVNEDNIDLNRNFINWDKAPPADHPLNDKLQTLLLPENNWRWPLMSIGSMILKHGMRDLQQALSQGQYSRPDGLFYGGDKEAWSNTVWRDILSRWTEKAEHVVHVDIHTGLGAYGHGELITSEAPSSPSVARANQWFGDVRSTEDGSSVSAKLSGFIEQSFKDTFNEAAQNRSATSVTLEFGTLSPLSVLKALAFDNWVHANGKAGELGDRAADHMRKAFAPDDAVWRRRVITRGEEVLHQAKEGLTHALKFGA